MSKVSGESMHSTAGQSVRGVNVFNCWSKCLWWLVKVSAVVGQSVCGGWSKCLRWLVKVSVVTATATHCLVNEHRLGVLV